MSQGLAPVGFAISAEGMEKIDAVLGDLLKKTKAFEAAMTTASKNEGAKRTQVKSKEGADAAKEEAKKTKALETEAKKRERAAEQSLNKLRRETEKWQQDEVLAEKRKNALLEAEAKRSRAAREQFLKGVVGKASGTASRIGGAVATGVGILGTIGGGAGIAEAIGQGVKNSASATVIANNTGGDKGAILSQAQGIATGNGFSTSESLEAIDKFTAKTGDIKMAQAVMGDLAKLANATGASFSDLAEAAGLAFNSDKKQSAENLLGVMRNIAAQGDKGALDMRDLAKSMPRITATAAQFAGNQNKNTQVLGGLAQLAMAAGTATTADEATMSVSSLSRDIATNQKEFKAAGVQTKNQYNQLLDPESILKNAVVSTKGDPTKLLGMFGARSFRAVEGYNKEFVQNRKAALEGGASDTEATQKGLDAAQKMLHDFTGATMTAEQVTTRAGARTAETDKRVEMAMEKLRQAVGEQLMPEFEKLIPVLESSIPIVKEMLAGFVHLMEWIGKNPFEAAFAGVGLIVANALVSQLAEAAIGKVIASAAGGSFTEMALIVGVATLALTAFAAALDSATDPENKNKADKIVAGAANGLAGDKEFTDRVTDEGLGWGGSLSRGVRWLGAGAEYAGGIVTDPILGTDYKKDAKGVMDRVAVDSNVADDLKEKSLMERSNDNFRQASEDMRAAAKALAESSRNRPPPPSTGGLPPTTDGQH